MIEIIQAGRLTTIQDLGRQGLRHFGIIQAGALNTLDLKVANLLSGNDITAAAIECHSGPLVIQFKINTRIAITGADPAARLNNQLLQTYRSYPVTAGQLLSASGSHQHLCTYFAVAGGVDVELILGSRSVDLIAGFGGGYGRPLINNDVLHIGSRLPSLNGVYGVRPLTARSFFLTPDKTINFANFSAGQKVYFVRAIPGPDYFMFSREARRLYWNSVWQKQINSNRMACLLNGPSLNRSIKQDILSHAVLPGTVQVANNGQPIILLADAQTTGGYPNITSVITADQWRLAKIPPLSLIKFIRTNRKQAIDALNAINDYIYSLENSMALKKIN